MGVPESCSDIDAARRAAVKVMDDLKAEKVGEILKKTSGDQVLLDLALLNLKNLGPERRAELVSRLMDQNCGPDVVAPICATSRFREFELESINFVIKRYMTSAIKKTTDEILLNCTSIVYKFMHPIALARNSADLNERYMSLLMGYPYPYTIREQPRQLRHLSLDVVIPFLKRHIPQLKAYGAAHKPNCDVGYPECVKEDFWSTTQELEMKKSKLVQGIFALLTNPEIGNFFVSNRGSAEGKHTSALQIAVSFIDVWYIKWLKGLKDDQMNSSLAEDIRNFLLEIRYWNRDRAKRDLSKQIDRWESITSGWELAEVAVDDFHAFVKQHSSQLVGNEDLTPEQCELRPGRGLLHREPLSDGCTPLRSGATRVCCTLFQCEQRRGVHDSIWTKLCSMLFLCDRRRG